MPRKPGFLIIGAMKAGTTTLYDDLRQVPGLYLPPEKEPDDLINSDLNAAAYFAKFDQAPPGALCGEASTAYTKRPTYDGVADTARLVLGHDLKLIYLTRDPIRRVVSQYHHQWGLGLEKRGLNQAVRDDPSYRAYSRYDWQLAPWRTAFGNAAILVVSFEDYLRDRPGELTKICAFLGVPAPATPPAATHRNKTAGKAYVPRGSMLHSVMRSRIYQFTLKPLLSPALRDRIKTLVLPKTAPLHETLHPDLEAELRADFGQDAIARRYLENRP